jgi:hypothetical protein
VGARQVPRDPLTGLRAERHAVLLAQPGHRLELELEPVAGTQVGEPLRLGRPAGAGVDELVEEVLEPARGDDLEDPAGVVAGVPERVPLVARLEDEVAGVRVDEVIAQ